MRMGMVDVSDKDVVLRQAETRGFLRLQPQTLVAIRAGKIKKGDPFAFAEAAGMLAVKKTSELIPHCHPLPIEAANLDFAVTEKGVEVRCRVKATARTGVEMEALLGVTMALNTIWDMVKYLEKDDQGQYPITCITDVRVVNKSKAALS
jgi:cyclic pyranopterin phosphate synthase